MHATLLQEQSEQLVFCVTRFFWSTCVQTVLTARRQLELSTTVVGMCPFGLNIKGKDTLLHPGCYCTSFVTRKCCLPIDIASSPVHPSFRWRKAMLRTPCTSIVAI